jgi:DNA adenine methylase
VIRSPFPYFGGKSKVADLVWSRLGDVPNYVEPFAGSLAVLLARDWPFLDGNRIETINDANCYLANFWRALRDDAGAVADWCDWPVNETDCHARHLWLVQSGACAEFREKMRTDPEYFDAKIAGWWVWGQCLWIGSGWCERFDWQQLPHLGDAGMGINRPTQQLPHLGNAGRGEVHEYLAAIAERLARVRVCCGDWSRVCGPTPTVKQGLTGVFLDPPYADEAGRESDLYAVDSGTVAHDVRKWALQVGDDKRMRIALCGYEGEHAMPSSWECVPWKARGGYGSQGNGAGRENAAKERIWFSPHCIKDDSTPLFTGCDQ